MKLKKTDNSTNEKVAEIISDFKSRQAEKRSQEEAWLLNINFLLGNQNTTISPQGEIIEKERLFPNESREIFNHIAPIVESRLAKLGKVRPSVAVMPSSGSDKDKQVAKISHEVLKSEFERMNISEVIKEGSVWSEVTGSCFYKLTLENGEPFLSVVSPFEIFPESSAYKSVEDCPSIIHARGIDVDVAKSVYGLLDIKGEDIFSLSLDGLVGSGSGAYQGTRKFSKTAETIKHDQVMVIERYTKPNYSFPNGLLEIVVGDTLVYSGDLPLGEYPFVRLVSNVSIGSFWGTSVIERIIPVQRAYNAVKNRKLEFLSRLSSGVLAVEEGSVDVDMLETEGLTPGRILVYRSGSSSPRFMDGFSVPPELNREEDRLLEEMNTLAGVSDLMRNSILPSNVTSGTAINQLTEADDTRLSVTAEEIRNTILNLAKLVLRVIKSHSNGKVVSRVFDENGDVELLYWSGSDIKADDVVLDTVNELSESISSRRATALELFRLGLFLDENGKLDNSARLKVLDCLGFGNFESAQDMVSLHNKRAKRENVEGDMMVLEVDDHDVHITEHTRFIIESKNITQEKLREVLNHIRTHKLFREKEEV